MTPTDAHDCLMRPDCRTCAPSDACLRCGYSPAAHAQRIDDLCIHGLSKDKKTGLRYLSIKRKKAAAGAATPTTAGQN
jgi:hypothetical protein